MCPKTSKTTPLLLIAGIVFVIVLVAVTGITLINNINLSNIIRLNEKVASDSVSANDNQIKELNYVNNHPKNLMNVPRTGHNVTNESETEEAGEARTVEQIRQEMSSLDEPKVLPVIGQQKQQQPPHDAAHAALPMDMATGTPTVPGGSLIDYEKRAHIVKVSGEVKRESAEEGHWGDWADLQRPQIAYQFRMSDLWGPVTTHDLRQCTAAVAGTRTDRTRQASTCLMPEISENAAKRN